MAYEKARKGKSKKNSVIEFEKDLLVNIKQLQSELILLSYKPRPLNRFIVRDPKTRTIHSSAFRDRVIHHALINVIGSIYEKIFISDSYASRITKGTHPAVDRFDFFKRKVSKNGRVVRNSHPVGGGVKGTTNNLVQGYCFKADIKKYFDTVNHEVLVSILKKKLKDDNIIWLIKQILENFEYCVKGIGMPLGNYTSQFFANVYLNELDYFVKHRLKARCYIRYVDDFIMSKCLPKTTFFRMWSTL